MATQSSQVISTTDEARACAALRVAFGDDPIVRWFFPDSSDYLTYFPRGVIGMGGGAFANGSAHSVEEFSGVALWLPPGVGVDEEAMGALLQEGIPAPRQAEVFGVLEQMGKYHPHEAHWYLPLIGVDPAHQGRGYGSALLRHALERCDRDGALAYLEASSPRNKPLYERHGFEEIGVIQSETSPPIWPMVRKPR